MKLEFKVGQTVMIMRSVLNNRNGKSGVIQKIFMDGGLEVLVDNSRGEIFHIHRSKVDLLYEVEAKIMEDTRDYLQVITQ